MSGPASPVKAMRREMAMEDARIFLCARCGVQVIICSCCDRGHQYCPKACAMAARRASQRQASRRYQATPKGRLNHANRASRYRSRKRAEKKVTHHPSPAQGPPAKPPTVTTTQEVPRHDQHQPEAHKAPERPIEAADGSYHCSFCGRTVGAFLRVDFRKTPSNSWINLKGEGDEALSRDRSRNP